MNKLVRPALLPAVLLISLVANVSAGVENDSNQFHLTTPRNAVYTFLYNLQGDHYAPDKAAKPFLQKSVTPAQAKEHAVKLFQVINGEGIYINLDEVPDTPNYRDTSSKRPTYVLTQQFPDIYLQKTGDKWLFSGFSINKISEIHRKVYPFGTHKLMNMLPQLGHKKYLGLHVWQHIAILILIILCYVTHKVLTYVFEQLIFRYLKRQGYDTVAEKLIAPVARPVSLFFVFMLLVLFVPIIQLPIEVGKYVVMGIKAALPLFVTIVCYNFVNIIGLYLEKVAAKTDSTLDDQLVPLVRKILRTFVVIIGGLVILQNLNVPILPLLTGLSIGGLAFALAAQDTIKNFFGSLMIFIDKPFQIGDWITAGDVDGTVEEVGFRATRIRTFRNSLVYVPNALLVDRSVDNHGLRVYRRFYSQISITYDTPPNLIEVFVEGLEEIVKKHPETRKDFYNIYLNDMGSHSLNIMFYIFFQVPSWGDELKARHEVILEVIRLAEELGVRFAFPTQTLHMETFPDKSTLTPNYNLSTDEMRAVMATHMEKQMKKYQ